MNPQITLFDDILGKNARRSDPEPSKDAGKQMNESGKRKKNIDIVLYVMQRHKANNGRPLTSRELYYNYEQYFGEKGINSYEVARRLSDLKSKSLTGKKLIQMEQDPIYCSISHKNLSAYSAV